jgi:glycosyltransferase involved in cell wall biosynthesis
MKKVLLIIPAYNEAKNIKSLLNEIESYKHNMQLEIILDVLVINDCSTDETSNVCNLSSIIVIDLPCNLGIGGAVQTGYKYAYKYNYDIAVQVDGDGQHDPSYLSSVLVPLIQDQADLVIGSRYIANKGFQSTQFRRIGIRFFSNLLKLLSGSKISDPTSGFRACNIEVIKQFSNYYPKDYPEPESIMCLLRLGHRIEEVPVQMRARKEGISSINIKRSIYYMLKVTLAILIDRLRANKVV